MRNKLTRASLDALMERLACSAGKGNYRVFLVGGATALVEGWRESTIDADLHAEPDDVFRDIQRIKDELQINVEYARPEHFVPPLAGSEQRHVHIRTVGNVAFYHYDPCAQLLSKILRGFTRDVADAQAFLDTGMVDPGIFKGLVHAIPESVYAKYPALSSRAVKETVDAFLAGHRHRKSSF